MNDDLLLCFRRVCTRMGTDIPHDCHEKVRRVMIFFWVLYSLLILFLAPLVILESINPVLSIFFVVLQLNVTKIFESLNKTYDKTTVIQSNLISVKTDMLNIAKKMSMQLGGIHLRESDLVEKTEGRMRIFGQMIERDVDTFIADMRIASIVLNAMLWKTLRYTKYLEKGVIHSEFISIREDFEEELQKSLSLSKESSPSSF